MNAHTSPMQMADYPPLDAASGALQHSLYEVLQWRAQRTPDRVWMMQPVNGQWQRWTYGEALRQIRAIAGWLRSLQLPPGSRVCISGRNSAHWHMADMAAMLAGHVAIGLYSKQGRANLDFIFRHSEARVLFVGPTMIAEDAEELMRCVPAEVITVGFPYAGVPATQFGWEALLNHSPPLTDYTPPADSDMAMLIYTSGTSGMPKGVIVTHGNLKFVLGRVLTHTPFPQPQERLFSYLPLAHLMERVLGEAIGIVMGAETWFLERVEDLASTLAHVQPTRFAGVPLVYARIQSGILGKLPQHKLDRMLRTPLVGRWFRKTLLKRMGLAKAVACGSGSAPMPLPLIEWFGKLGIEIYQGYGMTETCAYAAIALPGANRPGSVGKPMPGSGLRISAEGELQFRHPGVTPGYYQDEEQTRALFTDDGWLRTGDCGHVDADGYVYITGRIKDIFKTGKGKYVAPVPIESAMARNTDLDQVCLVGAGLNQPILLATLNPNGKARPREALLADLSKDVAAVNATLEDHERIARCLVLDDVWTPDNGLLTPTAKIKRGPIESRYGGLIEREARKREPLVAWVDAR